MSDTSDFELFSGPAPSEKSEMSDEAFRDSLKRDQKAMQALKKEEDKAKANDNNLASTIVQFLGQPDNTDLFLLISRAVAQNIPSEIIIAVLSLIDKRSHEEVKGLLEAAKTSEKNMIVLMEVQRKTDFDSLSPAQKKAIDKWIAQIAEVSAKQPHRVLETVIVPGNGLSPVLVQLSAFILRSYLLKHDTTIEFQVLRDFMENIIAEIVKNLTQLLKEQKRIA